MREVKQGATATAMLFLADSIDHVTGKTGLTLAVSTSKAGAAFAGIAPAVTERGNGWYAVALSAADTDTLGDLVIRATSTGADPGERVLNVVANTEAETYARIGANGAGLTSLAQASVCTEARLANLNATVGSRASDAAVNAAVAAVLAALAAHRPAPDYPVAVTYRETAPVGEIATVTWASGAAWTYLYDAAGKLARVIEA